MNKEQLEQLTKMHVDGIMSTEIGTEEYKQAMTGLKMVEEMNIKQQELDYKNDQHRAEMNLKERERKDKLFDNASDRELKKDLQSGEIQDKKDERKKTGKNFRLEQAGKILIAIISAVGGGIATYMGIKAYDHQTSKAMEFEQTGTFTTASSKSIMGNLKFPK